MNRDDEQHEFVMGYANKLSVQQGDALELKVSTTAPEFDVEIIRFDHYFCEPDPSRDRVIASTASGWYPGRVQEIAIGSYAIVPTLADVSLETGFTFQCWFQPLLIQPSAAQCVFARWDAENQRGFRLAVESGGILLASFHDARGGGIHLESEESLIVDRWYFVAVRIDLVAKTITLDVNGCKRRWLSRTTSRSEVDYGWFESEMSDFDDDAGDEEYRHVAPNGNGQGATRSAPDAEDHGWLPAGDFLLGAGGLDRREAGQAFPLHCLNGKIDRPACWNRALTDVELDALETGTLRPEAADGCLAVWDLAQDVATNKLVDISGNEHHGRAVNMPMRAVTGANWDGTAVTIAQNPAHYGAIAFHQDDLDDCGWETDLIVQTEPDWPSGVYAARLHIEGSYDYVPFYLRPSAGSPKAKVLFLAPTNTYLAYGNEKQFQVIWTDPDFIAKSTDVDVEVKPLDRFLLNHPELGASIYDLHPDGSGICHSSRLRPVLTMRPRFLHWLHNQARHFPADLYLIEWLEREGIAYDVATDEDLHLHGASLLDDYAVVLTGSHPEYWTFPMLQGLEAYLEGGGKLMYLGGNGFYWVTAMDDASPHFIEVRRGVSGIRAWSSHPGEITLATTGEPGGLWRHRGLPPNSLCGVGFASEGWGGAPGYVRTEGSFDPRAAFIFEGVGDDEIIGDFGFIMNGAAGDEIDRLDYDLGTPTETLRLATTELRHSDYYQLVVEDCSFVLPGLGGTEEPRVRADLTYLEDRNGGAVFSTGSINWIGSLTWNGGRNNVSTITRNVLQRFAGIV